jgi:hypothetical protein
MSHVQNNRNSDEIPLCGTTNDIPGDLRSSLSDRKAPHQHDTNKSLEGHERSISFADQQLYKVVRRGVRRNNGVNVTWIIDKRRQVICADVDNRKL